MAASFKNHAEVVKELLNGGANPDIRNMVCIIANYKNNIVLHIIMLKNGETALSLARACEHFDVVEQLKSCTTVSCTRKRDLISNFLTYLCIVYRLKPLMHRLLLLVQRSGNTM